MNDDVQLVREIGEVKAELSGLKAEVAGTNQRLDDIVITQLKDHGKRLAALDVRIAALEAAENKRAGGLSVLAGVAAAAGTLGALIMNLLAAMGLPEREAVRWNAGPGEGYTLLLSAQMWMRDQKFEVSEQIPYPSGQGDNSDE